MVQIARPRAKEMSNFRVEVIDGPLPADFIARTEMEPQLVAAAALVQVTRELMDREPLFHRPEFGFARADFEKNDGSGILGGRRIGPTLQPQVRSRHPRTTLPEPYY